MAYIRIVLDVVLALIAAGGFRAMLENRKYKQEVKKGDLENLQLSIEILMQNIVEPLKREINDLHTEIGRLREALQMANICGYNLLCPVLDKLQGKTVGAKPGERAAGGESVAG